MQFPYICNSRYNQIQYFHPLSVSLPYWIHFQKNMSHMIVGPKTQNLIVDISQSLKIPKFPSFSRNVIVGPQTYREEKFKCTYLTWISLPGTIAPTVCLPVYGTKEIIIIIYQQGGKATFLVGTGFEWQKRSKMTSCMVTVNDCTAARFLFIYFSCDVKVAAATVQL
jgi:hypothetical protein